VPTTARHRAITCAGWISVYTLITQIILSFHILRLKCYSSYASISLYACYMSHKLRDTIEKMHSLGNLYWNSKGGNVNRLLRSNTRLELWYIPPLLERHNKCNNGIQRDCCNNVIRGRCKPTIISVSIVARMLQKRPPCNVFQQWP
jgi:hypothetical protein